MNRLEETLKELNVELVFLDINRYGYYVPVWRTIFVNQNLSYLHKKLVILHELKHVLDHDDYVSIYNMFVPNLKMERQANDYMIEEIIKEHEGEYNYTMLVDEFNIYMGWDSKYKI